MSLPAPTAAALGALERFGVRLGLETIRRLLSALGEPQRRFPAVLVAGTNGKGSTSALLASMLGAAGYRTGLYTSPHLEDVEERCRIDGVAVDGERLGAAVEAVLAAAQASLPSPPTYFEALTAAAFLLFAEDGLDLAVLEVGLGGRLDATNAAEPLLSVIAPIAFDHREHLGSTLDAIAREKAGILRAGRPAVVWQEAPEAAATVRAVAAHLGTPLRFANLDTTELRAAPNGLAGQRVRLRGRELDGELELGLLGAHQARNLALAAAAGVELRHLGFTGLDWAALERGARRCRWPGRLEPVALAGGRTVLLDGAHNPAGVAEVEAFLAQWGEPVDLLFGALADKEVGAMLPPLAARADRIVLTRPDSPRALAPADLRALLGGRAAEVEEDPAASLGRALRAERPLLVCGSLFLIGAVRRALRERFGVPPPASAPLWTNGTA